MSESKVTTERQRLSGLALAGLLLSFIPAMGPLALYFSYRGLYEVNASEGRLLGRGAAIVGLILGSLGTLALALGTLAVMLAKAKVADADVQCKNNLRVIGVGVNQYHEDHKKVYPRAVVPLEGQSPEKHASWLAAILPYLEVKANRETKWQALSGRLDLAKPWDDPANREALTYYVAYYQCPGSPSFDPHNRPGLTDYVGVAGVGDDAASLPKGDPRAGFFGYQRDVTQDDVIAKSGASYKMMVLETTQNNGEWIAGGSPTVRGVGFDTTFLSEQGTTLVGMVGGTQDNVAAPIGAVLLVPRPEELSLIGPGRPFGGCHVGGLNVLMADGSVSFKSHSMPPHLFRTQASLSDDPLALANLP
jgi:prepilin-type processing-associated H-X9-DG protein